MGLVAVVTPILHQSAANVVPDRHQQSLPVYDKLNLNKSLRLICSCERAMPKTIQTGSLLLAFQQEAETLLRVTSSIMIIFEMNGEILIANDAAARFFKRSVTSVIGENIYKLFEFEDGHLETYVLQLVQSPEEISFEATSKDRKFSCILSPMLSKGSVIRVVLSAQDVTERQRTEEQLRVLTQELDGKVRERTEELQKANQRLLQEKQRAELLANFSRVLIEYTNDYSGLLQRVSNEITSLFADGCIIALSADDQTHRQVVAVSHRKSRIAQEIRMSVANKINSKQNTDLSALLQRNESFIGEALTYDQARQLLPPELLPILEEKEGPNGITRIPLLVRDNTLGAIFVVRSDSGSAPFSSGDIAFLKSIAYLLAVTIENAQLFDDIKEWRRQLRGLSRQMVDLQEEQIRNLARELHDSVGQNLTAININLTLLQKTLPENYPDNVKSRLVDTSQIVEETVGRMRNIMADFLPPMLESYGLSAALLWYGQQFTKRMNIPVLINDNSLRVLRLPPQTEIGFFRIAQEALNNIAKYAHATQVNIDLKNDDDHVLMVIADDGVGFDMHAVFAEQSTHWGLAIMRERARAVDASFNIESTPGKGTKVLLRIAR
jgi:PAS domain S-box-containing protein